MTPLPGILAHGPWLPDEIEVTWRQDRYEPAEADVRAADAAIQALRERGSPCHDGLAARLAGFDATGGRLHLELQPARWALRLVEGAGVADSLTALCVVRTEDGRWLAGRRAAWLSSWAGRWALGAGGSVEVGESPADTLARELEEEWRLAPLGLSVEALVRLPTGLTMLIGLATVSSEARPVPDAEHDEFAWWPPEIEAWPEQADDRLRHMGRLLAAA